MAVLKKEKKTMKKYIKIRRHRQEKHESNIVGELRMIPDYSINLQGAKYL